MTDWSSLSDSEAAERRTNEIEVKVKEILEEFGYTEDTEYPTWEEFKNGERIFRAEIKPEIVQLSNLVFTRLGHVRDAIESGDGARAQRLLGWAERDFAALIECRKDLQLGPDAQQYRKFSNKKKDRPKRYRRRGMSDEEIVRRANALIRTRGEQEYLHGGQLSAIRIAQEIVARFSPGIALTRVREIIGRAIFDGFIGKPDR